MATPSARPTVEQIRADAMKHGRQLEAVLWLTVADLAARWGVSRTTVREKIAREALPYMTLGDSNVRRYHPDDVAAYEDAQRHAGTASRGSESAA